MNPKFAFFPAHAALTALLAKIEGLKEPIAQAKNASVLGQTVPEIPAIAEEFRSALRETRPNAPEDFRRTVRSLGNTAQLRSVKAISGFEDRAINVRNAVQGDIRWLEELLRRAEDLGKDESLVGKLDVAGLVALIDRDECELRGKVVTALKREMDSRSGYVTTLSLPVAEASIRALLIELKEIERFRARSKSPVKQKAA